MSSLDKALDEVIKSRPKKPRRSFRRASAKAALVGTAAKAATKPAAGKAGKAPSKKAAAAAAAASNAPTADKIIVSNLPHDVNEAQVKELFASQIGPTKSVTLNYDSSGRSKGVANIVFARAGDGNKACLTYNGRLVDGKTPMKVELVLDPSKPPPLSQRVTPAAISATKAGGATGARKRTKARVVRKRAGVKRPKKSLEDLDAEMADYTNQVNTVNPATAAT